MTPEPQRIERIAGLLPADLSEGEWRLEMQSPRLQSRYEAWRRCDPVLTRWHTPASVLEMLYSPGEPAEKDRVLYALLRRARTEPLAGQIVLQALLPGLKVLVGRMLFDAREREELWSIVMLCAWERIRGYPLSRRRRVAANVLLDTLHTTLEVIAQDREAGARALVGLPPGVPTGPPEGGGDVEEALSLAVAAGAISEAEAELILRTRIDGATIAEMCPCWGVGWEALKRRRQRAERRLQIFFGVRVPLDPQKRPSSVARVAGRGPALGLAGKSTNRVHKGGEHGALRPALAPSNVCDAESR